MVTNMGYVMYMVYANKPATIDEHRTNIEREIAAVSTNYVWKSTKIGFSVCSSASVPVLAMQRKSIFIHKGNERTFTEIKNFVDIQNHFCFI